MHFHLSDTCPPSPLPWLPELSNGFEKPAVIAGSFHTFKRTIYQFTVKKTHQTQTHGGSVCGKEMVICPSNKD